MNHHVLLRLIVRMLLRVDKISYLVEHLCICRNPIRRHKFLRRRSVEEIRGFVATAIDPLNTWNGSLTFLSWSLAAGRNVAEGGYCGWDWVDLLVRVRKYTGNVRWGCHVDKIVQIDFASVC